MKATLLKRLFSSVQAGSDTDLKAVCHAIVEDEKRLGHNKLARELEAKLEKAENAEEKVRLRCGSLLQCHLIGVIRLHLFQVFRAQNYGITWCF